MWCRGVHVAAEPAGGAAAPRHVLRLHGHPTGKVMPNCVCCGSLAEIPYDSQMHAWLQGGWLRMQGPVYGAAQHTARRCLVHGNHMHQACTWGKRVQQRCMYTAAAVQWCSLCMMLSCFTSLNSPTQAPAGCVPAQHSTALQPCVTCVTCAVLHCMRYIHACVLCLTMRCRYCSVLSVLHAGTCTHTVHKGAGP